MAALASAAIALLVSPVVGLIQAAPWSDAVPRLSDPQTLDALRLSLVCSLSATLLAVGLGLPLAWVLARGRVPGSALLRALVLLPLLVPPVVSGVGLLAIFGRTGLVGRPLERALGLTLPFTTSGVVLAVTFVALPFVVVIVEAALRGADERYEQAAATLGASRLRIFRTVTLPQIAPALAGGAALSLARALGEFGATITFAGNLPGRTQTMPLAVFLALETDIEQAILLSQVLLGSSLAVLLLLRARSVPVS